LQTWGGNVVVIPNLTDNVFGAVLIGARSPFFDSIDQNSVAADGQPEIRKDMTVSVLGFLFPAAKREFVFKVDIARKVNVAVQAPFSGFRSIPDGAQLPNSFWLPVIKTFERAGKNGDLTMNFTVYRSAAFSALPSKKKIISG
jgi:hypothetical protein